MHKILVHFISVAAVLSIPVAPASSATTKWFPNRESGKYMHLLAGKVLTKIECRNKPTKSNVFDFEYRLGYSDNPERIWSRFAVGPYFGSFKRTAEREGYTMVSYDSFIRPNSGLRVRCGVWQDRRPGHKWY